MANSAHSLLHCFPAILEGSPVRTSSGPSDNEKQNVRSVQARCYSKSRARDEKHKVDSMVQVLQNEPHDEGRVPATHAEQREPFEFIILGGEAHLQCTNGGDENRLEPYTSRHWQTRRQSET